MSKKDRARAAEIRRRLIDDEPEPSPFAGIRLVEKKEGKKPAPKPVERKKPGEIVKGYDPSASFADILYSFEHTGNPYSMPKSKAGKMQSRPTDFGAILDQWEGKKPAPGKKGDAQPRKSEYRPSRSFAEILRAYEGAPAEEEERKPAGKAAKPKEAAPHKPSHYSPSSSFGDILDRFEGKAPAKAASMEAATVPAADDAQVQEETTLFRKMEEDDEVSSSVAWTIFGGRNEAFVRPEPAAEEDGKPAEAAPEEPHAHYVPSRPSSDVLSQYESGRRAKPEATASAALAEPVPAQAEENSFFRKPEGDEKRSEKAVWSVYGGNGGFVRRDPELPAIDGSSFGAVLGKYEAAEGHRTFEDYIREKGDDERKKEVLTISRLRAMPPQSTLDLHGMKVEEADKAVRGFLEECRAHGLRKVSIITGKGLHSEDGIGVLRQYVSSLLDSTGFVSEKANAPVSAGGAGAFWIILKA